MRKILLVGNSEIVIYKFRKEIIEGFVKEGYEVAVAFPVLKNDKREYFDSIGVKYYDVKIDRRGKNPFKDFILIKDFKKILEDFSPNIVLSYTIKPNLYLAYLQKKYRYNFFPTITGFGTAINNGGFLAETIFHLYSHFFKNAQCVFVQNESAKTQLINKTKIKNTKIVVTPGSGVNVDEFQYMEPDNSNVTTFLYLGRIMKEKGFSNLIDAAKHFENYENIKFLAMGFVEENYKDTISNYVFKNLEIIPYSENVKQVIKQSTAIIHPSFHEGMSNVLLEAASMGRPIIASKIPGCQEIVDVGKNGFLFEAKNSEMLIDSINEFLCLNPSQVREMGLYGRRKVEKEFSRNIVFEVVNARIEDSL